MSFMSFFLQEAAAGAATGSNGASSLGAAGGLGSLGMMIPLVLILLVMYFFMIRPQNKKQKEMEKQIAALKKGDKVITIGGIHGTVFQAKEKTLVIKVDDNTKIEFNRSAIATVLVDKPAEEPKKEEKKGLFGVKADKKQVADAVKESENGAKKDE